MAGVELKINAWTGSETPREVIDPSAVAQIETKKPQLKKDGILRPSAPADLNDWADPRVGWGLILADNPDLSPKVKARADDAPGPLQQLLAHRKGVVLRWDRSLKPGYLRRYDGDGGKSDLNIAAGAQGGDRYQLPRYLLLAGGPEVFPWEVQYRLNLSAFVGRLSLKAEALERYVAAAVTDWANTGAIERTSPLLWSVDHGGDDITVILRALIARPIRQAWERDGDLEGATMWEGRDATASRLLEALSRRPPFVLTTSHGATGPFQSLRNGSRELGALVDVDYRVSSAAEILAAWSPRGAVWYAHACCSAGSDAPSIYATMFDSGGSIGRMLDEASSLGPGVSPLGEALLGAEEPLRAFIGHVEPTFDWPLLDPKTGGSLAQAIVDSLYARLFQPRATVGAALAPIFDQAGRFFSELDKARQLAEAGLPDDKAILINRLSALDRQSLVILGDPAVTVPVYSQGS